MEEPRRKRFKRGDVASKLERIEEVRDERMSVVDEEAEKETPEHNQPNPTETGSNDDEEGMSQASQYDAGSQISSASESLIDERQLARYLTVSISQKLEKALQSKRDHSKFIENLRKMFYKEQRSLTAASKYQKVFAKSFLKVMIVPFTAEKTSKTEAAKELYTNVSLNFGLDEDKQLSSFNLDTKPLFLITLRFLSSKVVHFENRQLVRLGTIDIIGKILLNHNEHHLLFNTPLRQSVQAVLLIRLKDKWPPVRAKAVYALQFFVDEINVIKGLKYAAVYDPNITVRKNAVLSLEKSENVSTELFSRTAYDQAAAVVLASFSVLHRRPMTLKANVMQKLLLWGLSHSNGDVRRLVRDELIPTWLELLDNNVITFLKKLDLFYAPKTTVSILNGIFRDSTEETFNKWDQHFLNESKLIPLDQLSVESTIYWAYVCSKFGKNNYCVEKLLPSSSEIIPYIEAIIEQVHIENETAEEEDRDEEVTYLLCLTHVIRIAGMCTYEEASRRNFQHLLKSILLNPILDEAPLLRITVEILHTLVEAKEFEDIISNVVQQIFDPANLNVTSTSRRRHNTSLSQSQRSQNVANKLQGLNVTAPGDSDTSFLGPTGPPRLLIPINASTPLNRNLRLPMRIPEAVREDLFQIKEKLAFCGLERNRLIDERDVAQTKKDFLLAHEIQQKIEILLKEEIELKRILGKNRNGVADETVHESIIRNVEEEAKSHIDNILNKGKSVVDIDAEDGLLSQSCHSQRPKVCSSGLLRGIVISTRFLICHRVITPSIRHFIDNEIDRLLLSEDTAVRIYTLNFLSMFAMNDKSEAKRVMVAQLRALSLDEIGVQTAAFKCIVDLLFEYPLEHFKFLPGEDSSDVPDILYNPATSKEDLEGFFLLNLNSYAITVENQTLPNKIVKATGLAKVLLKGVIKSEVVVAYLLDMWWNPEHGGTEICSIISSWLPQYSNIKIENALFIVKGLVLSLMKILNDEKNESDTSGIIDRYSIEDVAMKLVDFVLPTVSTHRLRDMPNGKLIHSTLAIELLEKINRDISWKHNHLLSRIICLLEITDVESALSISRIVGKILNSIQSVAKMVQISKTKKSIEKFYSKIHKYFITELKQPNFPSLETVMIGEDGSESESDDEPQDPDGLFDNSSEDNVSEKSPDSVDLEI